MVEPTRVEVEVAGPSKITVDVPGIWVIVPVPFTNCQFPAQVKVALERFKV